MSYFLLPSPDLSTRESVMATWENGFSEIEISRIITQGEQYAKNQASVNNGGKDELASSNIRQCMVSWFHDNEDNMWLYNKIGWIVRQLNGQFFDFDLTGFGEPFQYTVYSGAAGDHYTWHIDKGVRPDGIMSRKLSLVLLLSDPSEYEGGDLELWTGGNEPTKMQKTKGLVVAFPSWILHRVTPVTAGTRRSLVIWTGGPKFK